MGDQVTPLTAMVEANLRLQAEVNHLGTSLAAAKNDVETLRARCDAYRRLLDEIHNHAEGVEAERNRLAAQVARVREVHTDLTRRLAEAEDGAVGASDLTGLFDALYPKWSGGGPDVT